MGAVVTLGLGRLEVDWGKNLNYANHSRLFLPGDVKPVSHHYFDPETEGIAEELKPGLARPLASVKRRLELLGYTLSEAKRHFEEDLPGVPDFYENPDVSFEVFSRALAAVDVHKIALDPWFADHSLGDFAARSILRDPEFTKTAKNLESLTRHDGTFFENLDTYVTLRLLAENPANLDVEVQWRFADLVESGWAEESSFYEGLGERERYLIVTEGSSDGAIIRRATELLRQTSRTSFTSWTCRRTTHSPAQAICFDFARVWHRTRSRTRSWSFSTTTLQGSRHSVRLNSYSSRRTCRLSDFPTFPSADCFVRWAPADVLKKTSTDARSQLSYFSTSERVRSPACGGPLTIRIVRPIRAS